MTWPPIYILTYRRERVWTWEGLPPELQAASWLVVDREDRARLRTRYPGARTLISQEQGRGIGVVRQWVLDMCRSDMLAMLDDDLVFQDGGWAGGRRRFRRATGAQVLAAFQAHFQKLGEDRVGYTTCSTPFHNNDEEDWAIARPAHTFWISRNRVRDAGASFLGIPLMVDMKFALECVTAGLLGWSSRWFAAVDVSPSAQGGIAALRGSRGRRHEAAASYLTHRWPQYVRYRDAHQNARHMANIGTSVDVTFYFKRAARDAAGGGLK